MDDEFGVPEFDVTYIRVSGPCYDARDVTWSLAVFLFSTSLLAGALNSVAGGGSFLTLPALMYGGVSPVVANATSTMALWPGSLSSAWAYRREVSHALRWLLALGLISLLGGLAGAVLLVRTSDSSFLRLLPWLMLVATLLFTFAGRVTARLGAIGPGLLGSHGERPTATTMALQFVIAAYGGYFGGGMGIMMLAIFAVSGMTSMHAMNGLKALLAVAINGVALVAFVATGSVAWAPGLVMVAGGVAGGYFGASLARRTDGGRVRVFVVGVAWVMTAFFFWRAA